MNIPHFLENNKISAIKIIHFKQLIFFLLYETKELLVAVLTIHTESSENLGIKFPRKYCLSLNFHFLVMFIVHHPSDSPNVQNPGLVIYIFVHLPLSHVYSMPGSQ